MQRVPDWSSSSSRLWGIQRCDKCRNSEVPRETHYKPRFGTLSSGQPGYSTFPLAPCFLHDQSLMDFFTPLETLLVLLWRGGDVFPRVAKLTFSIALALRYAGHCPQWLLPPCGEGAACFSWTLWGCGNLDAMIISKQKKPTQNWRMLLQFCMPSGLRPVVFVKRDIDFLEKIREWEIEIYNSAHFPHRRTGFFGSKLLLGNSKVWRFVRSQHPRSSLCFDHAASFPEQFLDFRLYNPLDKFEEVIATECLVFAQESLRSKASDKAMLQHVVVSHIFQAYSWWWGGGTCTKPDFYRFLMACLNSKPQEIFNTLDIMAGQSIPHWFPLVRPS